MKTLFITILVIAGIFNAASAQQISEKKLAHIKRNLIQTFQLDNEELIETSLITVLQLSKKVGVEQLEDLKYQIASLSASSKHPSIRYKAWLTTETLANPAVLSSLPDYDVTENDSVYSFIQNRIQLATNNL